MSNFESEILQRVAVLETKLDSLLNKQTPAVSTMDKWKLGGLIAAITTLINTIAIILQNGV